MTTITDTTRRRLLTALVSVLVLGVGIAGVAVVSLGRSLDRVHVEGLGEQPPDAAGGGYAEEGGDGGDAAVGGDAADGGDGGDGGEIDLTELEVARPDALTVLVLGSDTREVLSPEERRELGTGYVSGERTEPIALLRLDPEADELRMLNVPRDTLLTRCDGSEGRINAAYSIGERAGTGGLSCVVKTLTAWSGVVIDHAVKVDFRGFVDIVDTVGGVPMTLDEPIVDERASLDLPAGCTRLDGAQALAFVRARGLDNNFGRIERQQRFVEELRTEIAELGILTDLPQLYRTARAVARAVELDSRLTLPRIQRLARQHRATLELPIDGRSIPGRTDLGGGPAFLRVEEQDAREAFRWLEGGEPPEVIGHDAVLGEPDEPRAGTQPPESASSDGEGAGGGRAAVPERC